MVIAGLALAVCGLLVGFLGRSIGHLPGDIRCQPDGFSFSLLLASCLLGLCLWLWQWW